MKKNAFFGLLVIILAISFISCNNEQDSNTPDITDPNLARIVIPLPSVPNSRAVGLENAKNHTNYFEAFFRRTDIEPNMFHSAGARIQEGIIEVNIPVGIYDILLLAGNNIDAPYNLLLASSYVLNKSIILEQVNVINMTLATIDVNIISPTNVALAGVFNVEVEINTKNTLINNPISLSVVFNNGNISVRNNWNSISSENNIWKYKETLNAPLISSEGSIKLGYGAGGWTNVNLYYPFENNQLGEWYLAYFEFPELGSYYTKTIKFIEGQVMPEVEIIITWPDE